MLLQQLVRTSRLVAETSSRLAKIDLLAALLREAAAEEIEIVIAYLSGSVRQAKLGVGWATLQAARTAASENPSLSVLDVDETLARLASTAGKGSAASRNALLRTLFARATTEEQDFLVRLLTGELRQGALEGLMVEAVARSAGLPAPEVRRAAMLAGDLGAVARAALDEGAAGLSRFTVRLLSPIRPMLARTAAGVQEALALLGTAAFEYKLDGARIQVHKSGTDIRAFSRLMNDVTVAVPEVVEVAQALGFEDAILDGEAIAMDAGGRPLPFQSTMRRFGRKLDVEESRAGLPLTAFFFDAAIRAGHEGLVAKDLQAPYEAGARGAAWLKIKRADTLDLVVLAAEWGHGRRRGWLSNLHLGARDPAGGFVMLGKTFKGLTDEILEWQTKRLSELEVRREGHVVYVRPELVVEVAFNGLQTSPHYPAGLALRFARLVRYRDDKRAEEADTIETVRRIAGAPSERRVVS